MAGPEAVVGRTEDMRKGTNRNSIEREKMFWDIMFSLSFVVGENTLQFKLVKLLAARD